MQLAEVSAESVQQKYSEMRMKQNVEKRPILFFFENRFGHTSSNVKWTLDNSSKKYTRTFSRFTCHIPTTAIKGP